MKTAKLIHNPEAGDGVHLSGDELIAMVEAAGFNCSYLSVKEEGWKERDFGNADFLIAAGGDGTVKKTVNLILENHLLQQQLPLGLLPAGTANNIASALGISGKQEDIIRSWDTGLTRSYDLTMVTGLDELKFFIEGFGFGLFPYMVKVLKEKKARLWGNEYPGDKLSVALNELREVINDYPAKHCRLILDGKHYEGEFLMVEVLNIPRIGPNLNLAPTADPGDGYFDVVLVTEAQREEFADFVSERLAGNQAAAFSSSLRGSTVEIYTDDRLLHIDDEMVELEEPKTIKAEILNSPLMFFK